MLSLKEYRTYHNFWHTASFYYLYSNNHIGHFISLKINNPVTLNRKTGPNKSVKNTAGEVLSSK
jgi:hypothetical protein